MTKPDRPTAVLVLAIFHFIVGGMTLLGGLCVGGGLVAAALLVNPLIDMIRKQDPAAAQLFQDFIDGITGIPGAIPFFIAQTVLEVVLAVVLVRAGFGLLKMQPWARTASLVVAVLTILLAVSGAVYQFLVFNPRIEQVTEDFQKKMDQQVKAQAKGKGKAAAMPPNPFIQNPVVNAISTAFQKVADCVYPVVILIIMFRPRVRQAFARQGAGADRPPGLREEPDDVADFERRGYDKLEY